MEMVVAKILCLLGVFALMLAGILVPVRVMRVDSEKVQRYRRAVAFSNSFGGGVFLATCFNALLPAVREKVPPPHNNSLWLWESSQSFWTL